MRILTVTSAWPSTSEDPRGSFVAQLAMGLAERGHAITVVAPGATGAPRVEVTRGVRVYRAQYATPPERQGLAVGLGGIIPNLRARPWLALQVPGLVRAMRRQTTALAGGADLIHAHWLYPGGVAALPGARRANVPLVVTVHGGDINLARAIPPLRWWSRPVLRHAERLTAVSHAMLRGVVALGAVPTRAEFLPLGVQVPPSRPAHEMPQQWHDFAAAPGLKVLFAGGLSRRKSPDVLLAAIASLRARNVHASAALIGDGPLRAMLVAASTGLTDVWVVGSRPPGEVATWIRAADVVVLPSRSEGRGLILVEAMACGRAVVASDIPGPDELVIDGQTGFRFPRGDVGALAARLEQLASDSHLVRELGVGGHTFVRGEGLLLASSLDRHIEMYQRVLHSVRG